MSTPSGPEYADIPGIDRNPGDLIGPYRIVRELGRGGMGEVYLCERADDHYRQQVAVKVVNPGLMSRQVHNRLRTERQILASLDHPNIAKLLDGGSTESGVPYLVLEYIDGEPIDVYCDRRQLTVEARLRLFRTVCSAVHAAHRGLVVHRDLKPSNILVTAEGTPKLLDFGIAKLLEARPTAHTLALTQEDFRVMTPDHASPEQVRGELVTTASDVYVLGVLLYKLLCGKRPFFVTGLRMWELEQVVCEQQALAPSQRLREIARHGAGEAARIAGERSTTVARLGRQLAGDLDTIVMMAMRKEPERRYGSVEQMSADVERWLTQMPVIARKDTWGYRTRKFLVRHALGSAAAATLLALLSLFAVSTYFQAQQVRRERDLAAAESKRAQTERDRAEQAVEFLVDIFQRSDPAESRGADVTATEILERGARRVDVELRQQPQTQALLMDTIGRVYLNLGLADRAMPLLERSLELRRQVHGEADPSTAVGMRSLAEAMRIRGDLVAAEELARASVRIQSNGPKSDERESAASTRTLAKVLVARVQLDQAAQMYRRSIDALIKLNGGAQNEQVTSAINELASVLLMRGDAAEAARLYAGALATDRKLLGNNHPQVMHQAGGLALALQAEGKLAEAEPLFRESILLGEEVLGDLHPDTIRAKSNYGYFLQVKGDLAAAELMAREVLALDQKVRGSGHYSVGYDMVDLASVLYAQGRLTEAGTLYRQAIAIYKAGLPEGNPYMAAALTGLARVCAEGEDSAQVDSLVDQAVEMWRKEFPEDHWQVVNSRAVLGRRALLQRRFTDAEPILLSCYEQLEKQRGANDLNTRRTRRWLADLYTAWDKQAEAARYR